MKVSQTLIQPPSLLIAANRVLFQLKKKKDIIIIILRDMTNISTTLHSHAVVGLYLYVVFSVVEPINHT